MISKSMLMDETKEVCVYCRGVYAIRTYLKLRDLGIRVSCLGDADERKQGYFLDGIYCVSYKEILQRDKENTVILVCKERPENLIESFLQHGFLYVYSHEDVLQIRQDAPRITLDREVVMRINEFREKLYWTTHGISQDICLGQQGNGFYAALEQALQDAQDRERAKVWEQ